MKTKELIRQLQEQDPSGELEVVADGTPIYFAERLPAYYDGALQMLVQDHTRKDYNILGYKVTNKGEKVLLRLTDFENVLTDNPDAPIDLSELQEGSLKRWEDIIEKARKEAKE